MELKIQHNSQVVPEFLHLLAIRFPPGFPCVLGYQAVLLVQSFPSLRPHPALLACPVGGYKHHIILMKSSTICNCNCYSLKSRELFFCQKAVGLCGSYGRSSSPWVAYASVSLHSFHSIFTRWSLCERERVMLVVLYTSIVCEISTHTDC